MTDTHNPTPPDEGVWGPVELDAHVAGLLQLAEVAEGQPDGDGAAYVLRWLAAHALREAAKVKEE